MNTANLINIKKEIKLMANPAKAKIFLRFFKTGKGEYGYGDKFLGLTVPMQRKIAAGYFDLSLEELAELLKSKYHEHRFTALVILIKKFEKADKSKKKTIFDFYLKNTVNINNWDLVDASAPKIVGGFLSDKNRDILYKLAKSNMLWERRIAVLATFSFIKQGQFEETIRIAKILLKDKHDLIHKAVGWMLREVGKKNILVLENFLNQNKDKMPRIMLSYAIEKFEPGKRKYFLSV